VRVTNGLELSSQTKFWLLGTRPTKFQLVSLVSKKLASVYLSWGEWFARLQSVAGNGSLEYRLALSSVETKKTQDSKLPWVAEFSR
jgi:hypothetical protein